MPELSKCSRCHSEIELKYFSINRKGTRNKCCDNCLKKYQCDHCEYTSTRKNEMQRHIKSAHMREKNDTGDVKYAKSGEYKILQLLDELGLEKDIDYIHDRPYWNLEDNGLLYWNFILRHKENNPIVIEYGDVAHYKPARLGNMTDEEAQIAFDNTQRRDKIKNDYCSKNNISMLRIPYWECDNIEQLVLMFIATN